MKQLIRDWTPLAVFTVLLVAMTGAMASFIPPGENKVTKIVVHERVLLATDKQITNLFIDQLLTPKSAKCFRAILVKESNMRPAALNKQTGAKGMGQILASTYRNLGLRHSADPLAQSVAALAYISRHFGGTNSTCNAWKVWQKKFSY